jgi:hypothetical protein
MSRMSRELPVSDGARAAKKARQWRTSCIAVPLAWRSFSLDYEVFGRAYRVLLHPAALSHGCFEPPPLNDYSAASALVPLLEDERTRHPHCEFCRV